MTRRSFALLSLRYFILSNLYIQKKTYLYFINLAIIPEIFKQHHDCNIITLIYKDFFCVFSLCNIIWINLLTVYQLPIVTVAELTFF